MPYAADVLITSSDLITAINAEPQPRHEEICDTLGLLKFLQTKNQILANMVNVLIEYAYNPKTQKPKQEV